MNALDTVSTQRDAPYPLRRLVDQLPSMLAYWDRELRCRFANRAYERWFGVDPDGLIGTSIADLLGPELFALNELHIRAVLRGEQQVFERMVPGPGGVKRHSLATYIPDVVDGRVVGFIAHVTEVTPLKLVQQRLGSEIEQRERALELLRRSESSLREAQRLGRIGSWEWEAATDTMVWSDEMYRIYGRDPSRPAPRYAELQSLYTAASWPGLYQGAMRAVETGQPFEIEAEYLRPGGGAGWVEARGEAVRDAAGRLERMRGTVLEITPRRQMEEARIQLQVAEAANRNKTALLSRVSHDLRTPLNGILGMAQLFLSDESLPAKYREWAEVMRDSGRHMLDLVDEFLDLAAAEAGQIAIRSVELDLVVLLRECLQQAAPSAREQGVELRGMPSADAAPVAMRSDPKRLKQVIDNLVSNAIKYSRPGGVVTVGVSDLGATVELTVRDTGIGMSQDQMRNLFVAFERLGVERTGIRGTGVGLAFSKRIVELMGGSIEVRSREGEGSTFTVRWPSGRG
ncbi:MAG TPA: ATP-binding protein [Burkholderiaceae bacterium]|nr:ATP-binding protein [Burkholderiaceae bacterium]